MVNFSRPLSQMNDSQVEVAGPPQQLEMSQHSLSSSRCENAAFDSLTLTDNDKIDSPSKDDRMDILREPFNQPEMDQPEYNMLPNADSRSPDSSNLLSPIIKVKEAQESAEFSFAFDVTSFMVPPFEQKEAKKARYYSYALSSEDKHALAVGELNHNLKEWSLEDLILFHECRIDLIHPGLENQEEWIELRTKEKEKSAQYVSDTRKKQRLVRRLSGPALTTLTSTSHFSHSTINHSQASQSEQQLRVTSAPVSTAPHQASPISSVFGTTSRQSRFFSPADLNAHMYASSASVSDNISHPQPQKLELKQSRGSSGIWRSRQASPLSPPSEARAYEARPGVTFDSFLAPHISGKGEAFRGSKNAMQGDTPGDDAKDSIELKEMDGPYKKHPRRMSKMSNLSSLCVLKPRGSNENIPQD